MSGGPYGGSVRMTLSAVFSSKKRGDTLKSWGSALKQELKKSEETMMSEDVQVKYICGGVVWTIVCV